MLTQHMYLSDKGQYLRMASKSSLKDKLEDDELDLSMMQLSEVPVRVRSNKIKSDQMIHYDMIKQDQNKIK